MTPQQIVITVAVSVTLAIGASAFLQARTYAAQSLEDLASMLTAVNLADLDGDFFLSFAAVTAIIRNARWTYGFLKNYAGGDQQHKAIIGALRRETWTLCAYRRLICWYTFRALFSGRSLPYTDSLRKHYIEMKLLTLELAQDARRGDLVSRLESVM